MEPGQVVLLINQNFVSFCRLTQEGEQERVKRFGALFAAFFLKELHTLKQNVLSSMSRICADVKESKCSLII